MQLSTAFDRIGRPHLKLRKGAQRLLCVTRCRINVVKKAHGSSTMRRINLSKNSDGEIVLHEKDCHLCRKAELSSKRQQTNVVACTYWVRGVVVDCLFVRLNIVESIMPMTYDSTLEFDADGRAPWT